MIDPTAVVEQPSDIGAGTRVWRFCHVMAGARIGVDCTLGQSVFVAKGAVVGDRVKIQNNVSVYDGVTIDDDVFLGPSCVLTNVRNPRANRRGTFVPTRLRRGCTIGANATILCGTTIGDWAFVGAGAVVTKDVPAHALMVGVPATRIGWVSRAGYRLPRPDAAGVMKCPETGEGYLESDGEVSRLELA